ncbi:NCS1 nucleoside transporter family [Cytobacillus oceanisediminis]|jgi:cytosine permease|uniref:NCS1 nucleoside transporter family n=1 Tax=Cytobacillus oceanisediminis TaxID=665099 RepID=A0A2V2ZJZ4_9BACI|nr:cytosine permease [Cytobacillus oceanisediminis]PWW20265.1 NCS1 nucleoside transporter family [Cytobacillus oceanisediminis]
MSDRYKQPLVKDYEREPVPLDQRKGWGRLSLVWLGGIIALSATALGGALGSGLSLSEAIIASLIGCFLLAILSALCSVVGAKTGLSTSLVSMFALGRFGSYAVSIIIAIALFGWFGVQLDLFGTTLHNVIKDEFSLSVHPKILVVIGGVLMTSTAFIGYKAIEKLSIISVPLLGILLVASLIKVINERSLTEVLDTPIKGDPLTIGLSISLIIGSLATGAIIGPDISRYARSTKDAVISSFVGFFGGFSVVLIIAAILAKATAEVDIVAIMLGLGWGTSAMLILILAQWTTNDNNLYSSALGFSVVFKKVPKYILTITAGVIGTLMAVAGIYDSFIPFLVFLSALIPPIGGIYVGSFLLNSNKFNYENLSNVANVNLIGIIIWLIASLVAFFTTPSPNGFGLLSLTGASGFDAFLVAFVLQLIASSIQKNKENKENNGKTQRRILG